MIRPTLMAALLASSISTVPLPVFAQAQTPVVTAPLVCQTFVSNANPYGYVGMANVDLGSVFASIDTIEGTISGNRSNGPATITLPKTAPNGMWGNQGYLSPPWGNTGGWKSYMGYIGGGYPGTPLMMMDMVDVRFGTDDGIHPGKASVPQGVHGLYVVQRNERGHAPMKLGITGFNLKICGKARQVTQALPDCGIGPTAVGAACYLYMKFEPGAYPNRPTRSYSLSVLPQNYPNIVRCERPAPLLNLTAPGNVRCMRKYQAVKMTPINGNIPISDPSQGVEVFPPN
jgi:hypothetical protein